VRATTSSSRRELGQRVSSAVIVLLLDFLAVSLFVRR
jgi:hypothetical protein